jgi:hypothetical protein
MATAINTPMRGGGSKVELEVGVPQVLTLRFDAPKETAYSLMYGCEEGTLYITLKGDEASTFEHQMADLGLRKGDSFRVTKIKHGGRGGGFAYRIERTGPGTETESELEQNLRKSIEVQRARTVQNPAGAQEAPRTPVQHHSQEKENGTNTVSPQPNGPTVETGARHTFGKLLAGALCASISAYSEAAEFARAKGLPLVFDSRDISASASTLLIEHFRREGGGR